MENGRRTLLAVLAHPDDESFGMGGTLALYAQRGVAVHLVCATRGEAGEVDPEYMQGFATIAERRESELRCAAEKLGLTGVHFLDYRDSGMPGAPDNQHPQALAAAPLDEVAAQVTHYIRKLRPQVVATFDPIGGYKHPDHIAIHKATVKAFHQAGDTDFASEYPVYRPQKLYFHSIPMALLRFARFVLPLFGRNARRFGRNQDIDLVSIIEDSKFPTHARINYRSVADRKAEASVCHTSQLGAGQLRRGPVRWFQILFGGTDYFMRAHPPPETRLRERDLFEGIDSL